MQDVQTLILIKTLKSPPDQIISYVPISVIANITRNPFNLKSLEHTKRSSANIITK